MLEYIHHHSISNLTHAHPSLAPLNFEGNSIKQPQTQIAPDTTVTTTTRRFDGQTGSRSHLRYNQAPLLRAANGDAAQVSANAHITFASQVLSKHVAQEIRAFPQNAAHSLRHNTYMTCAICSKPSSKRPRRWRLRAPPSPPPPP